MRTYLVVIDDTPEAMVAVRFAARRAAKTGGSVLILALIAPVEFVGFAEVQATMEDEARQHAEALVARAAGLLADEGVHPSVLVQGGEPVATIRAVLTGNPDVAALVLAAASTGAPGPLVAHFAGVEAGQMPCPVMIVPGSLTGEALERLS